MQIIIKIGILLAVMLSSQLAFSQKNADDLYDSFAGEDGVTTISFSKSFLEPFEIFIDDDTKKVIYKMKKIRFMSYNEEKGNMNSFNVYERFLKGLNGKGYFEINPDDIECDDCDWDLDDDIKLFGKGKKQNMDEFHILVYDNDTIVLVSFYGDIVIDDIKACGKFSNSTKNVITF